jgi:hypothetical protein
MEEEVRKESLERAEVKYRYSLWMMHQKKKFAANSLFFVYPDDPDFGMGLKIEMRPYWPIKKP